MNTCGGPLLPTDFVISADEKTSVHSSWGFRPPVRVEHEYFRKGAWTYLAAWDVHRAKLFGRCQKKNGIAPTDRLMAEVMTQDVNWRKCIAKSSGHGPESVFRALAPDEATFQTGVPWEQRPRPLRQPEL
jgi:hypothetical protein